MSAKDNLSNELFFEAHRGLWKEPHKINTEKLGMHWSANYNVARNFSRSLDEVDKKKGVILHANIPVSSVETSPFQLKLHDVFTHSNSMEHEVPVKSGASVFVTGQTNLRLNPKFDPSNPETGFKISKRKRTYNPPREMKA